MNADILIKIYPVWTFLCEFEVNFIKTKQDSPAGTVML